MVSVPPVVPELDPVPVFVVEPLYVDTEEESPCMMLAGIGSPPLVIVTLLLTNVALVAPMSLMPPIKLKEAEPVVPVE